MVYYIKASARFLILLVLLFLFFFISILVFNIVPVSAGRITEAELKLIARSLFLPAFYISFVNASMISLFVYSFLIVDYHHIHRFTVRFIPFLITLFIFLIVIFTMKPGKNDIEIPDVKDARFFIEERVFFSYKNDPPVIISDDEFKLLYDAATVDEKKLLKNGYFKDSYSENYSLHKNIGYINLEKLRLFFINNGIIDDVKVYFGNVDNDKVSNIIISDKNGVYHFEERSVKFADNRAIIDVNFGDTKELCFSRKMFLSDAQSSQFVIYKLVKNNIDIVSLFFTGEVYNNIILWVAISYSLLTFSCFVFNNNFPFISIVFNLIFLFMIFYFLSDFYNLNRWFYSNIVPVKVAQYRYLIIGIGLFIPSLLYNIIRGVLHRAEKAELDGNK